MFITLGDTRSFVAQTDQHDKSQNAPIPHPIPWLRHQMETFSALLAICAGNSPVTGEFPAQRPVARSFDIFFDLCLNKWLSKQSRGQWFDMPPYPLWRRCNAKQNCVLFCSECRIVDTAVKARYGRVTASHIIVDVITYPCPNLGHRCHVTGQPNSCGIGTFVKCRAARINTKSVEISTVWGRTDIGIRDSGL